MIETEVVKIQLRRGTSLQFDAMNPLLSLGEAGYETDTAKLKVGNGLNNYRDLPYVNKSITDALLTTIQYQQGEITALQSLVDTKVSKSGDTMIGDLTIDKANSTSRIYLRRGDFDYTQTTPPSSNIDVGTCLFQDKNGKMAGLVQSYFSASNVMVTQLYARRSIDGTEKNNAFQIGVDSAGKVWYNRPQIISTYRSGDTWYRIWSDGWCMQGGKLTASPGTGATVKVTFPKVMETVFKVSGFPTTNYGIYKESWATIGSVTTTGMSIALNAINNAGNVQYNLTTNGVLRWCVEGYLAAGQY